MTDYTSPWHDKVVDLPDHVLWGKNFQIGGSKTRKEVDGVGFNMRGYQRAVISVLNDVARNPVGQIIVNAVSIEVNITPRNVGNSYTSRVFPVSGEFLVDKMDGDKDDGRIMAIGHEKHRVVAEIKNKGKPGNPVRNSGARAVEINFIPATFVPGSAFNPEKKRVFSPDGVLLHELVHAYRMQRGQLDTRVFSDHQSCFLDKEEFLAVLIANMYRSSKGARADGLRWSYDIPDDASNMNAIGGARHDSESFAQVFEPLLAAISIEIRQVWAQLAAIDCTFNPIKVAKRKFDQMGSAAVIRLARNCEVYQKKQLKW